MRCLMVGGTGFLGGAMADSAAAAGHEVTILSRGRSGRAVPKGARVIRTDRHGDLSVLAGRRFDWVFDSCAFAPDHVERLLDVLNPAPRRYVLISSVSAYGRFEVKGLTEDAPVPDATEADLVAADGVAPGDRASAAAYGVSYGPLKRACEMAAAARLSDRVTALRVGLLVGAGDYSDWLTWWVRRIDEARGDRLSVPAPGPPERPVQMIDVRDVADFALTCARDRRGGVWNVTGPPIPFCDLLAASTGTAPDLRWIDADRILAAGVAPWSDLPLMAPPDPAFRHFLEIDTARAVAAGLRCRPVADTLDPLRDWDRGRRDVPLGCGLSASQEQALLGPQTPERAPT